jgi:hypothetical protein
LSRSIYSTYLFELHDLDASIATFQVAVGKTVIVRELTFYRQTDILVPISNVYVRGLNGQAIYAHEVEEGITLFSRRECHIVIADDVLEEQGLEVFTDGHPWDVTASGYVLDGIAPLPWIPD